MNQPYQIRVVEEKVALDQKIEKLSAFLSNPPVDVPDAELRMLHDQRYHMECYSNSLSERIAAFVISKYKGVGQ